MRMLKLIDEDTGKIHKFSSFPILLGRVKECDLILGGKNISKMHARIELREEGLYLIDMDSLNGVFINGRRISSAKLKHKDHITIGSARFTALKLTSNEQKKQKGGKAVFEAKPLSSNVQQSLELPDMEMDKPFSLSNNLATSPTPNTFDAHNTAPQSARTYPQPASSPNESDSQISIIGEDNFRHIFLDMLNNATLNLQILTQNLDRSLFDSNEVAVLLTNLVRRHRSTSIKILVNDTKDMVHKSHQIIELYRRLPSNIKIRKMTNRNGKKTRCSYIIFDNVKILYQPDPKDLNIAVLEYTPSHLLMSKSAEFTQLWEAGTDPAEIRVLST